MKSISTQSILKLLSIAILLLSLSFSDSILNAQNCLLPASDCNQNNLQISHNPTSNSPSNAKPTFPSAASGKFEGKENTEKSMGLVFDLGPGNFTTSINCNIGNNILPTKHFRSFTVPGPDALEFTSVDLGISADSGGESFAINLYRRTGAPFPGGVLTQIASSGFVASAGGTNYLMNVPVTSTDFANPGDEIIIEVDVPGGGYYFYLGYGDDITTTWIQSSDCAAPSITPLDNFGIPEDLNLILYAEVSCPVTSYVGNVTFTTQAELDAWDPCYNTIDGHVTIMGYNITDLSALANVSTITGILFIYGNGQLTSLDGLNNLTAVGGSLSMYYNFLLANCCAIDDLLTNGGVTGAIQIFFNAAGCNSQTDIHDNCAPAPLVGGNQNSTGWDYNTIQELKLYPNPASNEINVQVNRTASTATLRVMDLLGRTVYEQELGEGVERVRIDLDQNRFGNGLYIVSFIENGEMMTKQLVVQR